MSEAPISAVPNGGPGTRAGHAGRAGAGRGRLVDWLIDRLASAARAMAAARVPQAGRRILEVGTKTGRTIAMMPPRIELVGVERRFGMLRSAAARRERAGQARGCGLVCADYHALPFADRSFDGVLVSFVLGGLAEPARVIAEIDRVVRRGGEIVVIDCFAERTGWRGRLERLVGPLGADRSAIELIVARPELSLTTSRRLPPLGLFSVVSFRKEEERALLAARKPVARRGPRADSGRRRRRRRAAAAPRPRR